MSRRPCLREAPCLQNPNTILPNSGINDDVSRSIRTCLTDWLCEVVAQTQTFPEFSFTLQNKAV